MSRMNIYEGMECLWNNRKYEVLKTLPEENYLLKDLEYGDVEKLTKDQIMKHWADGNLRFKELSKKANPEGAFEYPDFAIATGISEKQREKAFFRLMCIQPLLDTPSKSLGKLVIQRVKELKELGHKVSKSSLYDWLKMYRESHDIRALTSNHHRSGGKGKSRFSKEVEEIIERYIRECIAIKTPKTIKNTWLLIGNEIRVKNQSNEPGEPKLEYPSLVTIQRRVQQMNSYELAMHQYGKSYVKANFDYSVHVDSASYPLEVVQCDSTPLDVILVDDATGRVLPRPHFTVAIDVYSRYVIGFNIGFNPASYESVMLTLLNAIAPKDYVKDKYPDVKSVWRAYGLPVTLLVDNGNENANKHLHFACEQLGINLQFCRVAEPWGKPIVERFLKTKNMQLDHQSIGTTFSNTVERKIREYNSEKKAVIGFNTFLEMFHKWMLDYYSVSYHEGVENIPANLWEQAIKIHEPQIPASMQETRLMLLPLIERHIQKKGVIQWNEQKYKSPQLWELSQIVEGNKKVICKYDPYDISRIYVFDSFISNSYIEVPAANQLYTKGLSLYLHMELLKNKIALRNSQDLELLQESAAYLHEKQIEETKKKYQRSAARRENRGSNQTMNPVENQISKRNEALKQKDSKYQKKLLDSYAEGSWDDYV